MQIIVNQWIKENRDMEMSLLFHDDGETAISIYLRGYILTCPMDGFWGMVAFIAPIAKEMMKEKGKE